MEPTNTPPMPAANNSHVSAPPPPVVQSPIPPQQPIQPAKKASSTPWVILGVIVLIAVLGTIGGTLIFRSQKTPEATPTPFPTSAPVASPTPTEDEETMKLKTQGTSDDPSSIEADLNSTNLNNLDSETPTIESQLP